MLVIEIAGSEHSMEWSQRKVLRTGHHIMLDTEDTLRADRGVDELYEASVKRVERGYDLLRQSTKMGDTFALLKDHGNSKGQDSICRHAWSEGDLATAMSYVVEVEHHTESGKPRVLFHVANGNPCTSEYRSIPLIFPADEDIMLRATQMYFTE